MEKNNSDWIGPSETLALVMKSGRARDVAKTFILQNLCTEEITTNARWLCNDDMKEMNDAQVPTHFWVAADISGQRGWVHGDFQTVVEETNTKWEVRGVKFSLRDINSVLNLPNNKRTSELKFTNPQNVFSITNQSPQNVQDSMNDPGRPTKGYALYREKFRERKEKELLEINLASEAEYLLSWLKKEHPSSEFPTTKTIKNRIRDEFKQVKKA